MGKLASKYDQLHFCYEAGPTGYGLHRLIMELGHSCSVVAPSLIPRKASDRVKTNRRDAITLARLLRAGELTAVWIPDPVHEAMRNLIRSRAAAVETIRGHKQQVSAFLLRHSRIGDRGAGEMQPLARSGKAASFDCSHEHIDAAQFSQGLSP